MLKILAIQVGTKSKARFAKRGKQKTQRQKKNVKLTEKNGRSSVLVST